MSKARYLLVREREGSPTSHKLRDLPPATYVPLVFVNGAGESKTEVIIHPDRILTSDYICGQCGTAADASEKHTCDRRLMRRVQRNEMLGRARLLPRTPEATDA